jgi:MATE family multidrug resistance protein
MVIPTYLVVVNGGSIYWAWAFVTAHIIVMSVCFWLRFRAGKWKSMRVIEQTPPTEEIGHKNAQNAQKKTEETE